MTGIDYIAVQESAEFQELRSKHRRFVFPVTAAAFGWFILYVLLASYARDFMATQVFGHVNIGLLLGLSQFVTTFGITAWYVHYANKELDPRAAHLRAELEGLEGGGTAAEGGRSPGGGAGGGTQGLGDDAPEPDAVGGVR